MTAKAETQVNEKEAAKEALKAREKDMAEREKKLNEGRTGKGTRVFLGMTRGRNPQEIQYEAFDESQPDTLPSDLNDFMQLYKAQHKVDVTEAQVVSFLIDGYNSANYTAASDPIAEFVDASWPEELQKQFRTVVRNYSSGASISIDDAVALLKPGFVAAAQKLASQSA